MAKKDRFLKSKSIYSIKKRHALTNDAVIYENDHITIIPNDGIYDEGETLFSESNFKYKVRTEKNEKRKHSRRGFITTEGQSDYWTLKDISATTKSEESQIITKPNYGSLRDFAYYGSAVELIRATVNDIIQRFPGGITKYEDASLAPKVKIGDKEYTLLSNEFEIDCWTGGGAIASGDVKNPMRVLAASYMNYEDDGTPLTEPPTFSPSTSICPNSIIGNVSINGKPFPVYMDAEGKKYLLEGDKTIKLKPKQEIIDAFWNSLDDFERVLLNRDTTPVYKATFETPYSDETGYYYSNKSYIWPTVNNDGFTPDISTGKFQNYLSSLISLASFHDEYDTDNIWRMMTHESIKNLNWTFVSHNGDESEDLSDIDTTGIGAMIRIYGRQFDDIKRYADNIKSMNSISYDQKNNMPDYFLSDTIENDGWEAQHCAPFENVKLSAITATHSYSGINIQFVTYTSGKTASYVNSEFQRRLALNSDYIQSLKGTRRGIEAILGMFGYENQDWPDNPSGVGTYKISEYVAVLSSGLPYTEAYTIRTMGGDYVNVDEETNFMRGYPVAVIKPAKTSSGTTTQNEGENNSTEESEESTYYLVPWFSKTQPYDYPFYFQTKGGWGKRAKKTINLSGLGLTDKTELISGDTFVIYGETQPYMKYAGTIDDMLLLDFNSLREGTCCYVTDITNIAEVYKTENKDEKISDPSNYFILKNKVLAGYCGFVDNDLYKCYGWQNVPSTDIKNLVNDGRIVAYLESLEAEFKGNNPHIGFGEYDDGQEYLHHFENLFEGSFKDGKFDYLENSGDEIGGLGMSGSKLYETVSGYGFDFADKECIDNIKCHFYIDTLEASSQTKTVVEEQDSKVLGEGESDSGSVEEYKKIPLSALSDVSQIDWGYPVSLSEFNPEGTEAVDNLLDESQANGVVNIKKLKITFTTGGNTDYEKYLQNVVFKYLEPMIPSTAILEYDFS